MPGDALDCSMQIVEYSRGIPLTNSVQFPLRLAVWKIGRVEFASFNNEIDKLKFEIQAYKIQCTLTFLIAINISKK